MIRRPRFESEKHLAFIRSLPCLVTGMEYGSEAAHVRYGDIQLAKRDTGMAEKPGDYWTVPLSNGAHRRQHSMGERAFWLMHGINPLLVASLLWLHTGDDEAGRTIIMNARNIGCP